MWWLRRERRNNRSDDRKRFAKFYHTKKWYSARLFKLAEQPLCECCLGGCCHVAKDNNGSSIVTAAYHVDHVIPLAVDWDKRLDWQNLASICVVCHAVKTTTIDTQLKKGINNKLRDLFD